MTTVISCMDVAWQELGLAPALLSNNSGHRIMVRVGAAVPDAETPGHILGEGDTLRLEETGTVYGRIIREGQGPATIVVTPIETAASASRGAGNVDANTQRVTLATNGPMVTAIGAPADAPAASDNAAASMMAFLKRFSANWTSLLAIVLPFGRAKVEPLGTWAAAQTATAGSATASVSLGANTRRVSITARGADLYFRIGTGAVTASAGNGNGFLGAGATKDFSVAAGSKIAFIRAGSSDATIEIDELGEPS